jgi:hypothetical protein
MSKADEETIARLLAATNMFKHLRADELSACAARFQKARFEKGRIIFARGEPGTPAGNLQISGNVILNGGGPIVLNGDSNITGTGTLTNVDNTIWGGSTIGDPQLSLVNQGTNAIALSLSPDLACAATLNGGLPLAGLAASRVQRAGPSRGA